MKLCLELTDQALHFPRRDAQLAVVLVLRLDGVNSTAVYTDR
jgi:hypothetical protein